MTRDGETQSSDVPGNTEVGRTVYSALIRPVLFRFPPELIHDATRLLMQGAPSTARLVARRSQSPERRMECKLGPLRLSSPVGLAPGFDKNGDAFGFLTKLGFGYVTVGSIMLKPRSGNPRPRLARRPGGSLINCMGLPSKGLDHVVEQLDGRGPSGSAMIGNIQGFSIEEYATLLEAVEPHVDAIEMSMLCPNVVDKEFGLLTPAPFSEFVAAVAKSNSKPWFVKLPSYEDDEDRKRILQLAEIAAAGGAAGITVSGAFVQPDKRLSIGRGNVTGTPALGRTLTFVSDLYRATGGLPIKALGGITSGADAFRAIGAGASVVELYTSFIYRGPNVAGYITEELRKILDERGIGSIEELRGTALT